MFRNLSAVLICCLLISQCKLSKNPSSGTNSRQKSEAQSIVIQQEPPYRPSSTKDFDLIHTRLDLRFNYTKRQVSGIATIRLKPHFYPKDSLRLDAVSFLVHRVAWVNGEDTVNLKYRYDNHQLHIKVGQIRQPEFTVLVAYTAQPEKSDLKGSAAITDAKGLYFINPDRSIPGKPRQIWTQGETRSNSCWFPTIDEPNQKMTQEILITVDAKDVTLSNGELVMSKDHSDGTRTDHWKQSLPHAPYLTMIAVGEFAIVKDYWRDNMEVNYYVEPAYKPYAKLVFGHTPDMLEFFSKRLGVDYPWEKFSQIVVRDFVSGAMENTSCVVHGEALQHTSREHLDNTYEDVISHELFHHWFGDLVTCESWSNIPLNESFATYGEYLWNEHRYGRMHADQELDNKLNNYISYPSNATRIPIRYRYKNQDDLFDGVSYQKGGRILHMLRYTVGDSAFFTSLKTYLTEHKFSTAEIHDLRMVFEKVTGEDLNWFFDQWFLTAGHPTLDVSYRYLNDRRGVIVKVRQWATSDHIYKLPIRLDIYGQGYVASYPITIEHQVDSFYFEPGRPISFVNFDADKILVATIVDRKSKTELANQFLQAPLYADKWFALKQYAEQADSSNKVDSLLLVMADYALENPYEGVREMGIDILKDARPEQVRLYEFRLRQLAQRDPDSHIRAKTLDLFAQLDARSFEQLFIDRTKDSSFLVEAAALKGLKTADPDRARKVAMTMESGANGTLLAAIGEVYAALNDTDIWHFFIPAFNRAGVYRINILRNYWEYTMMQLPVTQLVCLNDMERHWVKGSNDIYVTYFNNQFARQMRRQNQDLIATLEPALAKQKKGSDQEVNITRAIADLKRVNEALNVFIR